MRKTPIPKFTRQDFEWLADTIFDVIDSTSILGSDIPFTDQERDALVVHFANRLVGTNPNFNMQQFLDRATVDSAKLDRIMNGADPVHWATTGGVCTCGAVFANNKEFRQHHDEMTR